MAIALISVSFTWIASYIEHTVLVITSVGPVGASRDGGTCSWRVARGLHERVGGAGRDAAVVVLVARHLDVAELSPRAAPRVLHEPVVAALLLRAVAHHHHLRHNHTLLFVRNYSQTDIFWNIERATLVSLCFDKN